MVWMASGPDGSSLKAFVAVAPEQPVVMLNLLRFVDGGAERYDRYLAHLERHGEKVGARILYDGRGADPIVAETGKAWDAVLLVSYPNRRAFSTMVRDPEYQRGTHLRTKALSEAVLQPTTPADLPQGTP
jgi:uncharacterized protein (DUF1330 family)